MVGSAGNIIYMVGSAVRDYDGTMVRPWWDLRGILYIWLIPKFSHFNLDCSKYITHNKNYKTKHCITKNFLRGCLDETLNEIYSKSNFISP